MSQKKKVDDGQPYIKKPPNAFMLFRAMQRHNVAKELHITGSAKINVVLGQRWKMMSEQEQAPYFEQAHRERRAHEAMYPGWSPKDNLGKKAKRRKADNIRVPQNHHHHHFAFSGAPANQQPVMTLPYSTAPKCFPNHVLNNHDHSYIYHSQNNQKPFQELPKETLMFNGIPVEASLKAFVNQACVNQSPIKVLPSESFTTPGSTFQDLSNLAPNNQTTNYLAPNKQEPIQELPKEILMFNGIPVEATLKGFVNQACENQAPIKVLPSESFATPGSTFQDPSNLAPNNQTTNHLAPNKQEPIQELSKESLMFNGIPVEATHLKAFVNQARENQAPIKVLHSESFTTPSYAFQDPSNLAPNKQAPPFNLYEIFLKMAPEVQGSLMRLLDKPAT
ncbi:uncharacterized protein [Eucyclogobius newberryi]|uniref:uncharacterized protein n=1 Tax=Eucyclogobius newberryi TaxID=166745 RepID=UPI003B5A33C2